MLAYTPGEFSLGKCTSGWHFVAGVHFKTHKRIKLTIKKEPWACTGCLHTLFVNVLFNLNLCALV